MDNLPKKKKILYIITKSNWGGAQRYVFDLATSLDKSLFDAEVIVGGNGTLKQKLEDEGIPVTSLSSMQRDINLKKEILSARELWHIFREKKPDVVHLNSSKAGGIGALVARLAGVNKIIFTAHAWAFNENRSTLSKCVIGFLHWLTILLAHQTVAVSYSVKKQVSHFPFIKNKITVIYPGVTPSEFKSKEIAREEISTLLKINTELNTRIWIGTIAELHPVKGLPFLLAAATYIKNGNPDVAFVVVGEGEQRHHLEKIVRKNNLENTVYFAGFVEDAKRYIKAFNVFVLPSLSEAFGYVIAEAGTAGLPVIASNVGGIPEIIENGISGTLVPPKDSKSLALAIELYLQNPHLAQEHALNLQKRIAERFSLKEMVEKTQALYE